VRGCQDSCLRSGPPHTSQPSSKARPAMPQVAGCCFAARRKEGRMGQCRPRVAAHGAGRAPPRRSHPAPRSAAWRTSRPAAQRRPAQPQRLQPALLAAVPRIPVCCESCSAGMQHSLHPARLPAKATAASLCCRRCFPGSSPPLFESPSQHCSRGSCQSSSTAAGGGGGAGEPGARLGLVRLAAPMALGRQQLGVKVQVVVLAAVQERPKLHLRRRRAAVICMLGAPAGRGGPTSGPGTTKTAPATPAVSQSFARSARLPAAVALHVALPPGARCVPPRQAAGLRGGLAAGLQVAVALLAQDVADEQLQLRARDDLLRVQVEALEEVLVRLAAAHPAPRARAPWRQRPPAVPSGAPGAPVSSGR